MTIAVQTPRAGTKAHATFDEGVGAGVAWAEQAGPKQLERLREFTENPENHDWMSLEPWRGWTRWSALAAVVYGVSSGSPTDWDAVEEATRKFNRKVQHLGSAPDPDDRFIAGFLVGVRGY